MAVSNTTSIADSSLVSPTPVWGRDYGPLASLDWLAEGRIVEDIPAWFVDFFTSTRDIGAVTVGSSDNCTMTTLEDNWCLYRLAQLAAPERSLEIGIMRGSSSMTIARAFSDAGISCEQIGLDIDPQATAAATRHLEKLGLASSYVTVVADSRVWLPSSHLRFQFAFLDGDHAYDTVAIEFAEVWNRTPVGGWIVLHDTGSVSWGTVEDPGVLFFNAFDKELGTAAELTWLDSTACGADMRLRTSMGLHYSLPGIAQAISVGYGGMGMVRKIDDKLILSPGQFDKYRRTRPTYFNVAPVSWKRRVARRIASLLGV